MDMRKFTGSAFLKVDNLKDGPRVEMIVAVTEGSYGRPVLKFEGGTCLSLNTTNVKTLVRAYGDNSADWIGTEVELYVGQTKYQGEYQDSILVRPISPEKSQAERSPAPAVEPAREEMDPF